MPENFIETKKLEVKPSYPPEKEAVINDLKAQLENLDSTEASFFENQINLQIALAEKMTEVQEFALAIGYLETALSTVKKQQTAVDLEGEIHFSMALNNFFLENIELAFEQFRQAISLFEKTNNSEKIGAAYRGIGNTYFQQKKWTKALENYQTGIAWDEKNNNLDELARTFYNIRLLLAEASSPRKTLQYYQRRQKEYEKAGKTSLLGYVEHEIALVYMQQENKKKAFAHFEKALTYKKEHEIEFEIDSTYYFLAGLYEDRDEDEKAFEYYTEALKMMFKLGNYQYAGTTVEWLKFSLDDSPNEAWRKQAEELLAEAEKLDSTD